MGDDLEKKTETTDDSKTGATFTQEDMNRLAAKVRSEERAKFEGHDDMKAELARLREAEEARAEAEKTERQKEIDAAVKAERKKADSEWTMKLAARDKQAAIRDALRDAGADPDAGAFLTGEYEPETVEDIPEKVKALLEAKPHLVLMKSTVAAQGAAGTAASGTGRPGEITRSKLNELRATGEWDGSEYQKLHRAGKLVLVEG